MTNGTKLVAARIAYVSAIKVRMVVRSQAGRTLVPTTGFERDFVKSIYRRARFRAECDHRAIASARQFPIKRPQNPERRLDSREPFLRISDSGFERLHSNDAERR